MSSTPDPTPGQIAQAELVDSLAVEDLGAGRFRAVAPARNRTRLFGGHVLAHVVAAGAEQLHRPDLAIRSLHGQFLRSGTPGVPVELTVAATSDGRSFASRRITAAQDDRLLIDALVRYHVPETGARRHRGPPTAPEPHALPDFPTRLAALEDHVPDWHAGFVPVDLRFAGEPGRAGQTTWFTAHDPLGDDPTVHAAVAVYASDMTLLGVAPESYGLQWWNHGVEMASLDHSIWFHEPARVDDWIMFVQGAISAGAGRALAQGSMFSADGRLVATVVQDGVLRMP